MSIAEKIQTIAENEQKVYEAGKFAERNDFWGELTNYGQPKNYTGNGPVFNTVWTDATFKPTHNIVPTNANALFQYCRVSDLEARLQECGVTLDMSQCKEVYRCFNVSGITVIPELDLRNCNNFFQCFNGSSVVTIRKLILSDTIIDGKVTRNWTQPFINTKYLKNIEIEGTIFQDTDFTVSPLTKASIISVINALSSETTDTTLTLSLSAVNDAFETEEGAADGSTSEEWLSLLLSKSNWKISLE